MAQVPRHWTPIPHRPPLRPHALIQPPRMLEAMQQTRGILRTGALLAPRQTILIAVRQNNTMTSKLQPVIAVLRWMTRVFNVTPMYASKETGQLLVIVTRKLALPRTPHFPPTRRDRSTLLERHRRRKIIVAASGCLEVRLECRRMASRLDLN